MNNNDIFNSIISIGSRVDNTQLTRLTLGQGLGLIQSETYKFKIEAFRKLTNENEIREFKKTNLEYLVFATLNNDIREDKHFLSSKLFHFDLDDITPDKLNELTDKFKRDEYILFSFVSPSQRIKFGIELDTEITSESVFKDSYKRVKAFFEKRYNFSLDDIGNPSRACFVSYDPDIYINQGNKPFPISLLDHKGPNDGKKEEIGQNVSSAKNNAKLEDACSYLSSIRLAYPVWNTVCFALCSLGNDGLRYFKIVSKNNFYNDSEKDIESKFRENLKYYSKGKTGLNYVYSTATENGWVWSKPDKINGIEVIENYLGKFDIKKNEITKQLEIDNVDLTDAKVNSLYAELRKLYTVSRGDFDCVLYSEYIKSYNPLKDYFSRLPKQPITIDNTPLLDKMIECMNTEDAKYAKHFISKWLCSIVASVFGQHSPLCLVLVGEVQNTGKSEWSRRLFPPELKKYYAEDKLDTNEKDIYSLMATKLIIMDDEFGGKSKLESKIFKELTSKESFDFRPVYGRNIEHHRRLAVLCGTTNDMALLKDISGNRRIIPIYIPKIMNFSLYNSIDKTAFWAEINNLYNSGYKYQLDTDDINYLKDKTSDFEDICVERELFLKHFRKPLFETDKVKRYSTSEIVSCLEKLHSRRLNLSRLGAEIKKLGIFPKSVRTFGVVLKKYDLVEISEIEGITVTKQVIEQPF